MSDLRSGRWVPLWFADGDSELRQSSLGIFIQPEKEGREGGEDERGRDGVEWRERESERKRGREEEEDGGA